MKTFLFFLIGVIVGGFAMRAYDERRHVPAGDQAGELREDISEKLRQWHLTREDITNDLAKTGQVVRSKAAVVGDRIGDARIAAVIKSKYVLDRDLSARDIRVSVKDGEVTLSGTVTATELIGRAVALALDTDGVRNVAANLVVQPKGT